MLGSVIVPVQLSRDTNVLNQTSMFWTVPRMLWTGMLSQMAPSATAFHVCYMLLGSGAHTSTRLSHLFQDNYVGHSTITLVTGQLLMSTLGTTPSIRIRG